MTQETQNTPVAPKIEAWQEMAGTMHPAELWADLKKAQLWFLLASIAAFCASAFFVVGYFVGGTVDPLMMTKEQWMNAGLGLGITAIITAFQSFLYSQGQMQTGKSATIVLTAVVVFFGLFSEISQSMEREDSTVRHRSEESAVFKAVVGSLQAASSPGSNPALSAQIAEAQQKLARCEEKLKRGKEKHCEGDKGKLQGLIDSENRSLQAANQNALALTDKAQSMQYDENQHYGMIRLIKSWFGIASLTASFFLSLIIIGVFEIAFHYLGHYLNNIKMALRALGYATSKKKELPPTPPEIMKPKKQEFREYTKPELNGAMSIPSNYAMKSQPMTGIHAGASYASVNTPVQAQANTGAPVAHTGTPGTGATVEKPFMGFLDTNGLPRSKEHQYPLIISKALETGKANTPEQVKQHIDKAKETAFTRPTPTRSDGEGNVRAHDAHSAPTHIESNMRAHSTDMRSGNVRAGNDAHSGDAHSTDMRAHPDAHRQDAHSKQYARTLPAHDANQALLEAMKEGKDKIDSDTLKDGYGLYDQWKAAVLSGEIKPTAAPGKQFITRELCQGRKKTINPAGMTALLEIWGSRGVKDGWLKVNPKYTGKPPHPKYLLA